MLAEFCYVNEYIPDALIDLRYFSAYNFVGARVDGYSAPVAIITRAAAKALAGACAELRETGYIIRIFDTYRPQMAVDHFVRWANDISDTRMKPYFYPDVDKSELFSRGFIAEKSGHSRGSTVDLTLFDMLSGAEIDMGGAFDFFGEISRADYTKTLTEAQIQNRQILRSVMLKHGFKGIESEWWHFTLTNEPFPDTYFNFPVE